MFKTNIEFINHASVLISCGKISLLSDPWYNGAVFHHGWRLLHELQNDQIINTTENENNVSIIDDYTGEKGWVLLNANPINFIPKSWFIWCVNKTFRVHLNIFYQTKLIGTSTRENFIKFTIRNCHRYMKIRNIV